jgi:YidC/Oxa1 family membrane protein insertase
MFHTILVQPLLNLLVLIYNFIPDIGVGIILLTIIIRLLLMPSFHKSLKSQRQMAEMQPKLNELREKHKGNKEAEAKAMMDFYKENKTNPFASCLPLLVQLPLLIALYQVFVLGLNGHSLDKELYHWVHNPGNISPMFLHFVDLSKPNIFFGIIAGVAQYFQSRLMMPKGGQQDATMKALSIQTLYLLPAITILFSLKLPAGLPLYWIVTTLFAIGQQYYIMKINKSNA